MERPVPCYFFHVYDGFSEIDRDGTELPDLKAARHIALRHAGEILDDHAHRDEQPGEDWRLEVADEAGRVVFRLDFHLTDTSVARDANLDEGAIVPNTAGLDAIAGPNPRHVRD